jgi:transposase
MAPQIKTEQEMFPLVEGWLKSGLTQKQFCTTHQVPIHILAYWVGRYRKAHPHKVIADKTANPAVDTENASGFIRLAALQTPTPIQEQLPATNMEVVLPIGTIIRFSTTMPVSYLKELLSVCSH